MKDKKIIYIIGPTEGVENYWEAFEEADDALTAKGFTVINPMRIQESLPLGKFININKPMIHSADGVLLLPYFYRDTKAIDALNNSRVYGKYIAISAEELAGVLLG